MISLSSSSGQSGKLHGNVAALLIALGLVATVGLALLTNGNAPNARDWYGICLLVPFTFYMLYVCYLEYARGEFGSPLSLFFIGGALYFGIFCILYYDEGFYANIKNRDYYLQCIIYTAMFFVTFHVTYISLPNRERMVIPGGASWSQSRLIIVALLLCVFGWIARLKIINMGIYTHASIDSMNAVGYVVKGSSLVKFFEGWPDLAAWMLWLNYLQGNRLGRLSWKLSKAIVYLLLLVSVLYWFPTGYKKNIIISMVVPMLIFYFQSKQLPSWRTIFTIATVVVAVFPLTYVMRTAQMILLMRTERVGATGFDNLFDLFSKGAQATTAVQKIGAGDRLFGRFAESEMVAGAMQAVHSGKIDLSFGANYGNLFVNLVPRAIWPDKPSVSYTNDFGHAIGVLRPNDVGTAIAPTLVGESFINFAEFGIFVGCLLALVYYVFYKWRGIIPSESNRIMQYTCWVGSILYVDSSFALNMSATIQQYVIVSIVCFLVSLPKSKRTAVNMSCHSDCGAVGDR